MSRVDHAVVAVLSRVALGESIRRGNNFVINSTRWRGAALGRPGAVLGRRAAALHPAAWWVWALGLATAASQTTNPLLLGLIAAVAGYVVAARRADTPWSRSYVVFLRLGLVVIAIRTLLHVVFGGVGGTIVLLNLPSVPLPGWMSGVRLGGPLTAEGLVAALYDGMRLAVLLCCVGAANALANPKRLLRSLPPALYELSVAVVVALTVAPQLVVSGRAIRRAQRLRGDTSRGLGALRRLVVPVLTDALDRSLALAAAMDSRGYGRTGDVAAAVRRVTAGLLLAGLVGVCAGVYVLLDVGGQRRLAAPLLVVGLAMAVTGLVLAARRVPRSRYRPDRWRLAEVLVAGSGVVAAVAVLLGDPAALDPSTLPLEVPAFPLLPAAGILVALLPAFVAPAPESAS